MKKLFSKNMDIVDYVVNEEFEKIANIAANCSDSTRSANIPTYEEQLEKNENDFAIIITNSNNEQLRKFAMYNAELTEINMAFLANNLNTLPEEVIKTAATNLTCSAKKFNVGIPKELDKYASSSYINRYVNIDYISNAHHIKEESTELKKYALHGKYPISNSEEIEKTSQWFSRNYNKLSIDEIDEFISNVKNIDHNSQLITKYANLNKSTFAENFYEQVNIRKAQLRENNEDGVSNYNDLLRRADEIGSEKCAYVLEVLDQEEGLNNYYGSTILNAYESTYGQEKNDSIKFNGVNITQEMLKKANAEDIFMIVGNDLTKELRSNVGLETFDSLPTPLKYELIKIL